MCYYCANGLPPKVEAIFEEVEAAAPRYEFGPGHIVFSDNNLHDEDMLWCLNHLEEGRQTYKNDGWSDDELEACRVGLMKLMALTEDERHLKQAAEYNAKEWDEQERSRLNPQPGAYRYDNAKDSGINFHGMPLVFVDKLDL